MIFQRFNHGKHGDHRGKRFTTEEHRGGGTEFHKGKKTKENNHRRHGVHRRNRNNCP